MKKIFTQPIKFLLAIALFLTVQSAFAQQTARLHFRATEQLNRTAPNGNIVSTIPLVQSTASTVNSTSVSNPNNVPNDASVTIPYTVASGNNRLLLVPISSGMERPVTSVTFNNVGLTKLGEQAQGTTVKVELWFLKLGSSVTGTTANVVVNFGAGTAPLYTIGVANLVNVDQTNTFGTFFQSGFPAAASINYNVSSANGDLVFDVVGVDAQGGSPAGFQPLAASNQSPVFIQSNSKFRGGASTKLATGGTTNMSWVNSNAQIWAVFAVDIKGVASSVTFNQSPNFCSNFVIRSGTNIQIQAHATVVAATTNVPSGTVPIVAQLRNGATTVLTLSTATNAGLAGANSTGILTWTGTIPADYTVNAGTNLSLYFENEITTADKRLDYNSTTKSSFIDLPTNNLILTNPLNVHSSAFPTSSIITQNTVNQTNFIRGVVTNPFGITDIASMQVSITGPANFSGAAVLKNNNPASCNKTFEFSWQPTLAGNYTITTTASTPDNRSVVTSINSFTINPIVDAVNDSALCLGSTSFDIPVLNNDVAIGIPGFLSANPNNYTVTIESAPNKGTATVNPNKTIAFNPAALAEDEVVTFTYRVAVTANPSQFDIATVTVRRNQVNSPPIVQNDVANTTVFAPVVINVLANDSDPDGTLQLPTITSQPSFGSVVVNPNGTITYTPTGSYVGPDQFSYQVCDNVGSCALPSQCGTALVDIAVVFAEYACEGGNSTLNATPVAGATGYRWTLPVGATPTSAFTGNLPNPITTTPTITLNWASVTAGQYDICLEPTNDCGPGVDQCLKVSLTKVNIQVNSTNVSCRGFNNGTISLNVSGGVAPYSYVWTRNSSPISANSGSLTGLQPGTYGVTVTDRFGCLTTASVIITEPTLILDATSVVTNENPNGQANGAINLTVTGGTAPYTFNWSNGATTEDISGLIGGFYTVVVTDARGCTVTRVIAVNSVGGPLSGNLTARNLNCFGDNTGSINTLVIGGTAPYTYSWTASNGGNVTSQNNLQNLTNRPAGNYQVTITDNAVPAVSVILSTTITQPAAALALNLTPVNVTCFGANNGSISSSVSGGTAPYTYSWNTGSGASSLNNLQPGSYSLTVRDANGCVVTGNTTITQPIAFTVSGVVVNTQCAQANGSITLSVVGAGSPTFLWSTGATTQNLSNVLPGTYNVRVTNNGCSIQEVFVVNNACVDIQNNVLTGPINNGNGTYTLTYQMVVTNTGDVALNNLSVTNSLFATYGANYTIVSTTSSNNFALNGAYNGNSNPQMLAALQSLNPSEQGIINLTVIVTPSNFVSNNPFVNNASVTGTDPNSQNVNDIDDANVSFSENPVIGLAKALTAGPSILADGSYNLTFTITVRNYGDVQLQNVQVTDNLDLVFGNGTYSVTNLAASSGFTVNNGYNGSSNLNLLAGSTPMAINEIRTITLSLNVTPSNLGTLQNQASGSANGPGGTTTSDLSHNGVNPLPNTAQTPNNFSDPTPLILPENGKIGVAKRVLGVPVNNNDGTYTVNYEIRVRNYGDVKLFNVQVQDDLTSAFTAPKVISASVSSPTLTTNPGFNGTSNIDLLATGNALEVNQSAIINLVVIISPDNNLGAYNNQALASGETAQGASVNDLSTNGVSPDPNGTGPENFSVVTPVSFTENPLIGANMLVNTITNNGDGTYNLVLTLGLENFGDVPLVNISALYGLANFAAATNATYVSHSASGSLSINNLFDGGANQNLLDPSSTLAFGAKEFITLELQITPGTNLGPYLTQFTVQAESFGGETTTDLSQNGLLGDPDFNGNPNNNSQPTPVSFTEDPRFGSAKVLSSAPVETSLGSGIYQLTYDIRVENLPTSNIVVNNIQVVDELFETFAGYSSSDVIINSLSILTQPLSAGLNPGDNPLWQVNSSNFDGFTNTEMLIGPAVLEIGEFAVIRLTVSINTNTEQLGGPFDNTAIAVAQSPGGRFLFDRSANGVNVDPNGNGSATDDSEPTPAVLFENLSIGLAKFVEEVKVISPTQNAVSIGFVVQNYGGNRLCELELYDHILTQFSALNPTNFSTTDGDLLLTNQLWNGSDKPNANSNILELDQCLEVGEVDTIYIHFWINNGPLLIVNNSATVEAEGPLGTSTLDVSQNGKNPDIDSDEDPTNNNVPTPIYTAPLTNPDINVTYVDAQVTGNLATNDALVSGFTFTGFVANPANPVATVNLVIDPSGTYTFESNTPGVYTFLVDVCASGATPPQTSDCSKELLTVTVLENSRLVGPVANTDIAYTLENTPVVLSTLANDASGHPLNFLDETSVTLVTIPNAATEGTLSVDPVTGNITFTPVEDFVGRVSYTYEVCDRQSTPVCAIGTQVIYVFPSGVANSVLGVDDYAFTVRTRPVSGNLIDNDIDPEGDNITVVPQNNTFAGVGTLVVLADGSFVFTPEAGFAGPANFIYELCDNGSPQACAEATLYVFVGQSTLSDLNVTWVNTTVMGDVNTNDQVVSGTTYSNPQGDVNNPAGATLNLNTDGTYDFIAPLPGRYLYVISVCAPGQTPISSCPEEQLTITVLDAISANNPPVANKDFAVTLQGQAVTLNTLVNDAAGTFGINLDPTTVQVTTTIPPSVGATTVNTITGEISFQPALDFVGTYVYSYEVCDNNSPALCAVSTQEVIVYPTGSDLVVIATDDYNQTFRGKTLTVSNPDFGILANDNTTGSGPLTASIEPSVSTQAGVGTLTLNANGTYTFDPVFDFIGTAVFPYQVCEGTVCAKATLYILVGVENTTIAVNDQNAIWINTAVAGDVTTNDFDLEGNTQTFGSFLNQSNSLPLISGAVISGFDPAGIPVASAGTLDFNADGTYLFTPSTGFFGSVRVPYNTCDNGLPTACDTAFLDISVNPIPYNANSVIATNDEYFTFGAAINGSLLINDADPQGDNFLVTTFLFDNNGDGIPNATGTLASPIQVGGKDLNGNEVAFAGTLTVSSAGVFNFVPAAEFLGNINLTYTICDNGNPVACANASVVIAVLSDLNGIANNPPKPNDDFSYTTVNARVNGNFISNDSDPNQDPISVNGIEIDVNGVDTIIQTITTNAGGTLQMRNNGTYTYIPPVGFVGADEAIYEICDVTLVDPQPLCSKATIQILVGAGSTLSGTIWNDVDGDRTLNNAEVVTNIGGTLFVNIVDADGFVVGTTAVLADGTYSISQVPYLKTVNVQISTISGVVGDSAVAIVLPLSWVNTGQNINGNPISILTGTMAVFTNQDEVDNLDFGIQERPTAVGGTATTLPNPGGTTEEVVQNSIFTGTDPDAGFITAIRIPTFPSNTTTVRINNIPYNSGNWPTGGVTIPTNANGNPTQAITLDPIDGNVEVDFAFYTVDNAGFESLDSSIAKVPFSGVRTFELLINSVCDNDIAYIEYEVVNANFDLTGLTATINWTAGTPVAGIRNPNNLSQEIIAPLTNQPLSGRLIFPGMVLDGNNDPLDWPGWIDSSGVYVFREDGFSGFRTNPTFSVSINPTEDSVVAYPAPTAGCSSNPSFEISGIVRNNINGFDAAGNAILGAPTNIGGQLFVSLVDADNNIIATQPVDGNGEFSFGTLKSVEYNAILHTTALGSATPNLPTNWVNTSQGANTVYNTTGNGICTFAVSASTFVEFGVQERPTAGDGNAPVPANLGENTPFTFFATVPFSAFRGSDEDGGSVTAFRISTWPSNTDGLRYNDTTYYRIADSIPSVCQTSVCLVFPTNGLTVNLNSNGNNFDFPLLLDAATGALNVEIVYSVVDNAGFESLNQSQALLEFNSAPLSVGCDAFSGVETNGIVALTWNTSSETNNLGFRIERSSNGLDFQEIGFVNGAGNSSITTQYTFNDRTPEAGINYYRLISIDNNQKESVECKVISVRVEAKATAVQVYPNPSNGIIFFAKGLVVIQQVDLLDAKGKVIINKVGNIEELNIEHLASGVYYVRVRTESGVFTHKIVNVK